MTTGKKKPNFTNFRFLTEKTMKRNLLAVMLLSLLCTCNTPTQESEAPESTAEPVKLASSTNGMVAAAQTP